MVTFAAGWLSSLTAGKFQIVVLCLRVSDHLLREEPVLSGSLAVRKVGGTWQEECWVRIGFISSSISTDAVGSADGLEIELVE